MENKLNEIYEDEAKMVRFRLNDGWDYVWITYHDVKGFITISSSYGNYSYIWSAMGKGVLLKDFFVKADNDYLAQKLYRSTHRSTQRFDSDTAFKELKQMIIQYRRDGSLNKHLARLLFDEIKDWESDSDELSREGFYNGFYDQPSLSEWNPDIWYNDLGSVDETGFLTLKNEIIPIIKEYFRGLK
jgi:hypothetical protein